MRFAVAHISDNEGLYLQGQVGRLQHPWLKAGGHSSGRALLPVNGPEVLKASDVHLPSSCAASRPALAQGDTLSIQAADVAVAADTGCDDVVSGLEPRAKVAFRDGRRCPFGSAARSL